MLNGSLKSLRPLWTNLANNQRYKPFVSSLDLETFGRRFDSEGLTFITVVLPRIGQALDSYHSTSEWCPPEGFETFEWPLKTWLPDGTQQSSFIRIPLFLQGAMIAALNGNSLAVDCVRQLTLIFYKLEVDYGADKEVQFLDNFRKVDLELFSVFDGGNSFRDLIVEQARKYIGRVLVNSDPLDIVPSHGSGSTACRTPNWEKHHRSLIFYEKLDSVYPYSDYFFYNYTHLSDEYDRLKSSEPRSVPQARVVLVPKDSRGPRVISCEPAELMFIQQGIMRKLYQILETNDLTSGYVNFNDQTVNRELACLSSKGERRLATIDLSDASDRVSLELVKRVFPANWFRALEACRSEETILPNGEIMKLNKFAPMGSSCCFPVEALVFWACAQAAIHTLGTSRDVSDVYVYGDDIVIDSNFFEVVTRGLESVGLKVNKNKSYWRGPFRESCGGDYHFGMDVTPVRVRKYFSKSRTSVVTNADLCNNFVAKYGYLDSLSLISVIEEESEFIYPRSELQLPAAIRIIPGASNDVFFRRRFNHNLQRWEYRILTCISESKQRQPPNWEELFRKQLCLNRFTNNAPRKEDPFSYGNQVSVLDSQCDPGWYTDPHSVITKWVWTWLG
jgi:hypothetical protein